MGKELLMKVARALATLFLTLSLTFLLLRLAGDPASALAPPDATQEVIEQLQKKWGFDKPLYIQYISYFKAVFQGDFGSSIHTGRPVTEIVMERIPATLKLGLLSISIAIISGVTLGIIASIYRNSIFDRLAITLSVFAFAMPNFFFGLLLILIAAIGFDIFVGSGSGGIWGIILPAMTLGLANMGVFARFSRSSMLEVLNKPYIEMAKAKGASKSRQILNHALPNAIIPIVTLAGLILGSVIAGAVVTEKVFNWPGVGSLLVRSVETRDLAIIQYIVFLVAATMSTTNLIVDLLYRLIDPRIRVK